MHGPHSLTPPNTQDQPRAKIGMATPTTSKLPDTLRGLQPIELGIIRVAIIGERWRDGMKGESLNAHPEFEDLNEQIKADAAAAGVPADFVAAAVETVDATCNVGRCSRSGQYVRHATELCVTWHAAQPQC